MPIDRISRRLQVVEETPSIDYSRKREETKFARAFQLGLCTLNGASLVVFPIEGYKLVHHALMALGTYHSKSDILAAVITSGIFGGLGGLAVAATFGHDGKLSRKDKGEEFPHTLAEEKYTDLVAKHSNRVRASGLMHGALRSSFTRLITYPIIGVSAGLESTVRKTVNFGSSLAKGENMFEGLPVTNAIRTQFTLWNLIDPQDNLTPASYEKKPLGTLDAKSIRRAAQAARQPSVEL